MDAVLPSAERKEIIKDQGKRGREREKSRARKAQGHKRQPKGLDGVRCHREVKEEEGGGWNIPRLWMWRLGIHP